MVRISSDMKMFKPRELKLSTALDSDGACRSEFLGLSVVYAFLIFLHKLLARGVGRARSLMSGKK